MQVHTHAHAHTHARTHNLKIGRAIKFARFLNIWTELRLANFTADAGTLSLTLFLSLSLPLSLSLILSLFLSLSL